MRGLTSNLIAIAVILTCAAPSLTANLWPRVFKMLAEGASAPEAGMAIAVAVSAIAMGAVPFAMKQSRTFGLFWLACVGLGTAVAMFNFLMACELAGKFRDDLSAPAAQTIAKAETLRARIAGAKSTRAALPPAEPWTTEAALDTAKRAVDTAEISRADECKRRGQFCRDRESDERIAMRTWAAATQARAVTAQHERLDSIIARAEAELDGLGLVPAVVDPAAARIGKAIGIFVDLGPRPAEVISTWWPTFIAAIIELLGLLGPRVILTAIRGREDVQLATVAPVAAPVDLATVATVENPTDFKVRQLTVGDSAARAGRASPTPSWCLARDRARCFLQLSWCRPA